MDYHRDIQQHQQKLAALGKDIKLINERIRHAHDEYHREAQKLREKSEYEIKNLERELERKENEEEREQNDLKNSEERLKREASKK